MEALDDLLNVPLERFRDFVHEDRGVRGTLVGAESGRGSDGGRTMNRAARHGDFSGRAETGGTPLPSMQTRTEGVHEDEGRRTGTTANGNNQGGDLNMSYEELLRLDENNVEI